MRLDNLRYLNENFSLTEGSICTNADIICPPDGSCSDSLDMNGLLALPGFIDIHTHGAVGVDVCSCNEQELCELSRYYVKNGVTSFCPTTMTLPFDELSRALGVIERAKSSLDGAYIQCVHLEGPYISKNKCGAQNPQYARLPDAEEFERLNSISRVGIVSLAPELPGADEFARKIGSKAACSAAHTDSDYNTAKRAFENGFTQATHLFNAMSGLSHRSPGVVGAVFDSSSVMAEIICDGFHVSPPAVRIAHKILGDDRFVAISDSLSCAGCPDGDYELAGLRVRLKNSTALLEDSTIAGSTTNLLCEFKNLLAFGLSLEAAAKACSANPARALGIYDRCGSIAAGKTADIIFLDAEYKLRHAMVRGKMLF